MTSFDRIAAWLGLLAGAFLLIGGLLLTRPLLDPDPTLPAEAGPLLEAYAAHYRGSLLLFLMLALTGAGVATALPALARRHELFSPAAMELAARWGFAAGLLWILRSLFVVTVQGPWALRYAGDLEPAARKELLELLWPLMRQVDWFFQWGGILAFGIACLCSGLVLARWPGRLGLLGTLQLLAAATVVFALLYVLPVHYPRRFAGPGFPRLGVYLSAVAIYETAALVMLTTGWLLLRPAEES